MRVRRVSERAQARSDSGEVVVMSEEAATDARDELLHFFVRVCMFNCTQAISGS